MKKISVIFSLVVLSFHLYGQDYYRSLLDKQETTKILSEVQEYGMDKPNERQLLSALINKINKNTFVVQFHLYGIRNYELLNENPDNVANNLEYHASRYILINKENDTVDNFGIYFKDNERPALQYNDLDYFGKEYDESMYWILNFIETTDWEKDKISVIGIAGVRGFFVFYKNKLYVPYRNRMVDFVTYFDKVEFFHYRFSELLLNKRSYRHSNTSEK